MHHNYEALDRSGGSSRVRLLAPLRLADFRLLWSGMCISLLGDGVRHRGAGERIDSDAANAVLRAAWHAAPRRGTGPWA